MRRGVALAATAVLVFGASSAAAVTYRLTHNIKQVNIDKLLPGAAAKAKNPADPNSGQPVNILLLGSDARNGENAAIGGKVGGMRSDTAIVLHISGDRSRVEAVSIPRDSIVKIPACTMTNGKTTKSQTATFNDAFAFGWDTGGDIASAAACAMNTVQVNTGIHLDHFVVVDFSGFQQMVDAVGGVPICAPTVLQDDMTGLDLTAGMHTLNGVQALQFARARHIKGTDGSDITRIKHQQQLLGALAHQVLGKNVLTNAPQLITFASAVTSSLTMDTHLTPAVTGLAYSIRNISSANIVFMTIPWTPAPTDKNRVVWDSGASQIWSDLAADTPIVPAQPAATPTSTGSAGTPSARPTTTTTPAAAATSAAVSVQDVQNQATNSCAA